MIDLIKLFILFLALVFVSTMPSFGSSQFHQVYESIARALTAPHTGVADPALKISEDVSSTEAEISLSGSKGSVSRMSAKQNQSSEDVRGIVH